MSSSGKFSLLLQMHQPIPAYTSPYLCPLTFILFTSSSLKSHSSSGYKNGAMNPPLAASTCIGVSHPVCLFFSVKRSFKSLTSSNSPFSVEPKIAATQIVFSSTISTALVGSIT
ncbi:hypothetical protein CsSME_00002380 [Camellia sinensis var. sinensis]